MSRYRGPRLRIVRRLGELPGLSRKTARRAYPPGQHGQNRKKRSEYGVRLEEKQKIRMNYGLTEKQLLRYVRKARRVTGSTGQVLLQMLEMRLDNTVFRLGMAPTIPAARQLVNHGHVTVNGKRVDIASYQCRPGEVVAIRDREASRKLVEANLQYPGLANLPSHLEFDKAKLTGKVNSVIEREWVALQVNELLVVEYYSRQA
ncbi:30S ribosomal protein S4 [Nodularia harveyana UHCC-0300]|uniref:Small ribosomal subunit protein uS4 n=1 Tax=Nodularia harveyana UHCC-0300 TaxID=2974287 RepID=A0ABU5UER7_9CYAN|nr:30S ribosomal protein S4 [Nodularia harveyana]MEA5582029.1 30S ribosomal protein S4 [Nodularia harveyana UHCC-0300]